MTVESRDGIPSHISAALSPPREKLAQEKLAQEKTCHVGQITCICTPSQEMSPRRETGRGFFDSDGDPHSRAHSLSQPAHCRKTRPRGRRPNPLPWARVRAAANETSRPSSHHPRSITSRLFAARVSSENPRCNKTISCRDRRSCHSCFFEQRRFCRRFLPE
jgi:hypothetical protein